MQQEDEKGVNHIPELFKKMVNEAMAAPRADVGVVKKKGGQSFVIADPNTYPDAVMTMKPTGDQSKAGFAHNTNPIKAQFGLYEGGRT
ncbi:MAG: DUF2193 family protein [Methanolinea sp.]|jgi:hypothetical protein